jgi:hypothetical protein
MQQRLYNEKQGWLLLNLVFVVQTILLSQKGKISLQNFMQNLTS